MYECCVFGFVGYDGDVICVGDFVFVGEEVEYVVVGWNCGVGV